ncbi:DUF6527 family protein [Anaerotignum faecicola]|jgi:hypothetical protein
MNIKLAFCTLMGRLKRHWKIIISNDFPLKVLPETLYIVGDIKRPQYAFFQCPCGCGRTVELNLNPETHPYWHLKLHLSGKASFTPSIWRKNGCRSHFFFSKSKIIWCERF